MEIYQLAVQASNSPDNTDLKESLIERLEGTFMTAEMGGLFERDESGYLYLKGYNIPLPRVLEERINEHVDNDLPIDPLVNFWKLSMLNPNATARDDLFQFATTYGFPITSKGYFVAYKAVAVKNSYAKLAEFVSKLYFKAKEDGSDATRMVVWGNGEGVGYYWEPEGVRPHREDDDYQGRVQDIFIELFTRTTDEIKRSPVYTDKWSQKMKIKVGVPAVQHRTLCDEDPNSACSYGLHVGNEDYVNDFMSANDVILLCLVNPMNVVAVPNHDATKMRTCEYFPYGAAQVVDGKIVPVDSVLFESDYQNVEMEEIENRLKSTEFASVRKVLGDEAIAKLVHSRLVRI